MTGRSADLDIPREILRRLEEIERELDAREHVQTLDARPLDLRVVPVRGGLQRRERRSAPGAAGGRPAVIAASLLVAVAVSAAIILNQGPGFGGVVGSSSPVASAAGLAGLPSGPRTSGPQASGPEASGPAPSAVASGSAPPDGRPTPAPTPRIVRGDAPARILLQKELHTTCLDKGALPGPIPAPDFITDAATHATGEGWLDAARTVWLGADPVKAAGSFGASVVVIAEDGSWIVVGNGVRLEARQLIAVKARGGIAYWLGVRIEAIGCR